MSNAAIALLVAVSLNVLLLWTLGVWNQPQHFDPPIEPPARLVYAIDPSPPAPPAAPAPPEPQPPPQVMEVNLDFPPDPPQVEPLDLQFDLSVPSVDAVFVPVQPVTRPPVERPAQPQPRPAPMVNNPREPVDAERVDQQPRELTNLQPAYPRAAERLRRTGFVEVRLLIDETGHVKDVEVLRVEGHAAFEDSVLDTVRRYRFDPARDRGRPVSVWATKTVRFELQG